MSACGISSVRLHMVSSVRLQGAYDKIEHYACPIFWEFASARRPAGLGLSSGSRSLAHFLLVAKGVNEGDAVWMAAGSYALARAHGSRCGEWCGSAPVTALVCTSCCRGIRRSTLSEALSIVGVDFDSVSYGFVFCLSLADIVTEMFLAL